MERVIYDNKPEALTKVGDGSYRYAWNIQPITIEMDDMDPIQQFTADEVIVWSPISANRITQAVINAVWPLDYEQKLVNEYNAAMLGVYSEEVAKGKIEEYKAFLVERSALKAHIDEDCAKLGIK